jgi:hypothetical protein
MPEMNPPARTPEERRKDTLRRLEHDEDAWAATADVRPEPAGNRAGPSRSRPDA